MDDSTAVQPTLNELLLWAKKNPPTEEELLQQGENLARNYTPGPRQAHIAIEDSMSKQDAQVSVEEMWDAIKAQWPDAGRVFDTTAHAWYVEGIPFGCPFCTSESAAVHFTYLQIPQPAPPAQSKWSNPSCVMQCQEVNDCDGSCASDEDIAEAQNALQESPDPTEIILTREEYLELTAQSKPNMEAVAAQMAEALEYINSKQHLYFIGHERVEAALAAYREVLNA